MTLCVLHCTAAPADRFGLTQDFIVDIMKMKSAPSFCTEESAKHDYRIFLAMGTLTSTRNIADTKLNGSSKLSAPLALGCISPRQVYFAALKEGEGAEWLASHMEMRDFFIYSAWLRDPSIPPRGMETSSTTKTRAREKASAHLKEWHMWATGRTGFPFPDAAMRQLSSSGYCSNRARQNALSLVNDLHIDWRAGASTFNGY